VNSNVIRKLAGAHAPARLDELTREIREREAERDEILHEFPELVQFPATATSSERAPQVKVRSYRANAVTGRMEVVDPDLIVPVRKRRRQSIEQRLATGRRMRAYWKKRRAEKKAKGAR
jgi:hypothetical protein